MGWIRLLKKFCVVFPPQDLNEKSSAEEAQNAGNEKDKPRSPPEPTDEKGSIITSSSSPNLTQLRHSPRISRVTSESSGNSDDNISGKHSSHSRSPWVAALTGSKRLPPPIEITDAMIRLETVISNQKLKEMFIKRLVSFQGDYMTRIRFIGAIEKYDEVEDKDEQKNRLLKIVEMFLKKGSMFEINLSDARKNLIVNDHQYNQLWEAKKEILSELTENPEILQILDEVEAMD